jgi:hypothetical protein
MDWMGRVFDELVKAGFNPRRNVSAGDIWIDRPRVVIRDAGDVFSVDGGDEHRLCNGPADIIEVLKGWSV